MIALLLCRRKEINIRRYILISSFLLLSCLAKETGLFFLPVVATYRILFIKKNLLKFSLSVISVLFIYLIIRFLAAGAFLTKMSFIPIAQLTLAERIINIPEIIFYYLKTLFFPITLTIDQYWVIKTIDFYNFYLPLSVDIIFFILLGILGWYIHKKYKNKFNTYLYFLFWFLSGLLMCLQILPLDMTVSDHWLYFPLVGLLGVFAVSLEEVKLDKKKLHFVTICGVLLLLLLSIRTIVRNTNWHDGLTLFSHDIKNESNFDIEINYATELVSIGQYNQALYYYNKSISLNPYEVTYSNIGLTYEKMGNNKLAMDYYNKAFMAKITSHAVDPSHKHSYTTYTIPVIFLIKQRHYADALKDLNMASLD